MCMDNHTLILDPGYRLNTMIEILALPVTAECADKEPKVIFLDES